MAGFATGSEELRTAAGQMMDTNQNLQGRLAKLASEVEGVQGAWAGEAAAAFQTLMQKFSADAKALNESLQQISENVTGSADAYQRQEEEANSSISSITSTLGG